MYASWVLTVGLVILTFVWMLRHYGKFWLTTIPCTFMWLHCLFNVLGANYVIGDFTPSAIRYISAMLLSVVIHAVVFVLTDHLFRFNFRREMQAFIEAPVSRDFTGISVKLSFGIFVFISLAITAIYIMSLESIPIIDMIRNPSMADFLAKSREMATQKFRGKYHRYSFFFRTLLPYLTTVALAGYYHTKDKFWRRSFPILFAISFFCLILDLQKAPVIFMMISLLYTWFILREKVEIKNLVWFSLGSLVLLIVMYILIMGLLAKDIQSVMWAITSRVLFAQTKGIWAAFRAFPNHHDYLMGTTLPNPMGIFPFKTFRANEYLFIKAFGKHAVVEGTAPTAYFTEFYYNFGYLPMIASMFLGAFVLQLTQIMLTRGRKSIFLIGLWGFLSIWNGYIAMTSFFISYGILFLALLLCYWGMMKTIVFFKGVFREDRLPGDG